MLISILACSLAFYAISFERSSYTKVAKFSMALNLWDRSFVVSFRVVVNRRVLISFLQHYRHNYIHFPDLSNSTALALVYEIVTVWMV